MLQITIKLSFFTYKKKLRNKTFSRKEIINIVKSGGYEPKNLGEEK